MASHILYQAERIAAMEVKLLDLEKKVDAMDAKLDGLLDLKNRGMGAFWLVTTIFGASIIGAINIITQWWRH